MAKDPAFLFYPGDWDGGTKLFSRHVKGAYMDLLMCQFHNGHMTSHDLVFILGQPDYDLYWESKLKSKFTQDSEGRFYNQKLESEQIKRRNWCESRANNKEGKNQYSGHVTSHMENVNKNVNVIKDNNNIEIKFSEFWRSYPKKKAKVSAEKSFKKINPDETLFKIIISAIEKSKTTEEWIKEKGKFIPHPATWLNNKRWLDEDVEPHPLDGIVSDKTKGTVKMLEQWRPPA
jgi:curved DNA-binding protein CbpA